jgi:hypothetical protein
MIYNSNRNFNNNDPIYLSIFLRKFIIGKKYKTGQELLNSVQQIHISHTNMKKEIYEHFQHPMCNLFGEAVDIKNDINHNNMNNSNGTTNINITETDVEEILAAGMFRDNH